MFRKMHVALFIFTYLIFIPLTFADVNIVIFGGKGDLAMRKLYPAIYNIQQNQLIDTKTRVIAIDLAQESTKDFQSQLLQSFEEKGLDCQKTETCLNFIQNTEYIHGDLLTDEPYRSMQKLFNQLSEKEHETIYFFSTSFILFGQISHRLGKNNLINSRSKVIVEKPLGIDLKSSQMIQRTLLENFTTNQIYRIDHYLAKSLVQSILTFRFKNPLFEDVWNNKYIDKVEINAFETLGIEKRAAFYDKVGALRDMVHSHLLQLLTLMAMEEPKDFSAESIQLKKVELLKKIQPITTENFSNQIQMKQYAGYQSEQGVPIGSLTETYVKIKLFIDTPRWKNVPFYITTGKKMPKKETEIFVDFKRDELGFDNDLYIEIDPTIAIKLSVNVLNPADKKKVLSVLLTTDDTSSISNWKLKDYDRLIYDVIQGDNTLFVSQPEIEASWRWIDNISRLKKELNYIPEKY